MILNEAETQPMTDSVRKKMKEDHVTQMRLQPRQPTKSESDGVVLFAVRAVEEGDGRPRYYAIGQDGSSGCRSREDDRLGGVIAVSMGFNGRKRWDERLRCQGPGSSNEIITVAEHRIQQNVMDTVTKMWCKRME